MFQQYLFTKKTEKWSHLTAGDRKLWGRGLAAIFFLSCKIPRENETVSGQDVCKLLKPPLNGSL